jgi:hypothetical protein
MTLLASNRALVDGCLELLRLLGVAGSAVQGSTLCDGLLDRHRKGQKDEGAGDEYAALKHGPFV